MGSEASRRSSLLRTPRQLIPFRYRLTPHVTRLKVETYGQRDLCEKKYSIPDPGSHSRRLVNGRSQSPGHQGTTSPLVLSTHHQRPHPHAGPEDSVSPLTRTCVQGLVRNLPFNHTIEVNSPPCRVTKEGRDS